MAGDPTMRANASEAVWLGLSAALSLGFVDLLFGVLPAPADLAPFSSLFPPLAATVVSAFLGFAVLVAALRALPVRLRPRAIPPVAFGLLVFAGGLLRFASPGNTWLGHFDCRPDRLVCPPYAVRLFLPLLVVSAGCAVFAARLGRRTESTAAGSSRAWHALPIILGEVALLTWASAYVVTRGVIAIAFGIVAAGAILVTLLLLGRARRAATLMAAISLLGVGIVAAGGAVLEWSVRPYDPLAVHRPRPPARPPARGGVRHVILITIDALRADALSCYRAGAGPTPNLDRLAAGATVFTQASAPSDWTLPSLASVMTGFSPWVHRTVAGSPPPRALPMLAELMSEAGYATAAVLANPNLTPRSGFSRGFDGFAVFDTKGVLFRGEASGMLGARLVRALIPPRAEALTSADMTALGLRWLEQHRQEPAFLWLHYMDPHGPYAPPAAFRPRDVAPAPVPEGEPGVAGSLHTPAQKAWLEALYRGEVRWVDQQVGALLEALDRLGTTEETLVVVTADHGEAFWEHGTVAHGSGVYSEHVSVPLIIKLPGRQAGARLDQPVTTQALFATILSTCGVRYSAEVEDAPLLPLRGGDVAPPVLATSIGATEDRIAVVFDGFKYIRSVGSGREELYDLSRDPGEQMSLVLVSPEMLVRGRALANAHLAQAAALRQRLGLRDATPMPLDEDTRRRMRALGYLR